MLNDIRSYYAIWLELMFKHLILSTNIIEIFTRWHTLTVSNDKCVSIHQVEPSCYICQKCVYASWKSVLLTESIGVIFNGKSLNIYHHYLQLYTNKYVNCSWFPQGREQWYIQCCGCIAIELLEYLILRTSNKIPTRGQ